MPEAATPAIILKDLEKYYPPQRSGLRAFLQPFERATRPALKGVSFEVQQGQAVPLLGANGAGKSTILRILATLLLPTRGQAIVAGCDTLLYPRDARRRLGYHAGSDQGFYPRLTGRENLLFFSQLNHLTRRGAAERIAELAKTFHLGDALDQQVRTLSSGTTQRLSLAARCCTSPRSCCSTNRLAVWTQSPRPNFAAFSQRSFCAIRRLCCCLLLTRSRKSNSSRIEWRSSTKAR
jgi:ABC-2 type transport system ATP-binding protein